MTEAPQQDAARPKTGTAAMMAKGGLWMVLARFALRAIGLVSTLILARVLVPADFGLVALATSIVGALDAMSEFSFDTNLIRDRAAGRKDYDSAWTLTIVKQGLMAAVLCAGAASFADFFNESRIEVILYILAAGTFMDGFANIGVVDLQKNFRFDKQFWFMFAPKFGAFFITVALAFTWRSYWALLVGMLSSKAIRLAMSYALHTYRPRLSLVRARSLVHFSKWLLLNNAMVFLNLQMDTFIIGRLIGVQAVGLYNIAKEVALLPTTELVWPLMQVVLPAFSRVGHNRAQLANAYLETLGIVWLIGAPAGIGIALVAEPAVHVLLGKSWVEAIPLMQVLAIGGALRVLFAAASQVYLVVGRPYLVAWLTGLHVVLIGPAIYLMVQHFQVLGASYALLLGTVVFVLINIVLSASILKISALRYMVPLWRPLGATAVMAAVILSVQAVWTVGPNFMDRLIELIALVGIGAIVFVACELGMWWMGGRPQGAESRLIELLRLKKRLPWLASYAKGQS